MDIQKESNAVGVGVATAQQLEKINALAKGTLTAEQVYVFSVRLCDDQVDRDFERFDTAALPELARMFVGKSGIVDHKWSAESQLARIFDTEVVEENGEELLGSVDDEDELNAVYDKFMEILFADEEEASEE